MIRRDFPPSMNRVRENPSLPLFRQIKIESVVSYLYMELREGLKYSQLRYVFLLELPRFASFITGESVDTPS